MTNYTPAQLEVLLAGAKPGPWTFRKTDERGTESWSVTTPIPCEKGYFSIRIPNPLANESDARLIAASPDLARLVLEKDAEIEKLRTAICWIEPPFIDESTSEAELRKRISFCVQDAKRAARQAMKETSDE